MNTRPPRISAFTLIELLVVIVIIAILAALALPAITSTIQKANSAKSIANLKQIGAGIASWSADNDGWVIATRGNPGVGGVGWWHEALTNYVGNVQPEGVRPTGIWANPLSKLKNMGSRRGDYGKNIHINEVHPSAPDFVFDVNFPPLKFASITIPSRIFLVAESAMINGTGKPVEQARDIANYNVQGSLVDYIPKKANVLFCDMSVRAVNPKDTNQVTPSGGWNNRLPPWRPDRLQ
jgi:prepilin-type N-terminal cleavage/methylation domain-containing protein